MKQKQLSHCGGLESCRQSDPPQAENPAKQDSFANCFVPFLAGDYDEIVMIDFRYGNENIYEILDEYDEITDILVIYDTYIRRHGISTYRLINEGVNPGVIQRLRTGKNISIKILNQLCVQLDCGVTDILVYVRNEEEDI